MNSLDIVLMLIEPPLPFGNAASRWFYVLLKELQRRGHRVRTFVAYSKEEEVEKTRRLFPGQHYDIRFYPFPKNRGWRGKIQSLLKPHSFKFSAELIRDLKTEVNRGCDVLHIEQLWAGWTGLGFGGKSLLNIHHLQSIDLEHVRPKTLKEWIDFRLVFQTEKRLVKKYPFIRSCSPRLVEKMGKWNPEVNISVVPVGIDASLYEYIQDEQRSREKVLSLIGNMGWYPGQSAAFRLLEELWPKIRERVPDAKLKIVGWSARSVLKKYIGQEGVEIFENVPDIKPYFTGTSVMLYAPSRGSGMKIKILEAMAFGIPVVTTGEGAEGLSVEDGIHMGLCEDNAGLIDRTVQLLNDVNRQNRMRKRARVLLENECGPITTVDAVEAIYEKIARNQR